MAIYSYIAKSPKGEEKSGIAQAKNTQQLARTLKDQGFILIKAFPEKEKSGKEKFSLVVPFLGGVSLSDKMMFTRNLQVMVSSGLSLPRSLQVLAVQTKNGKFKKAILEIKKEIVKGESFSAALEKRSAIFSELFKNMIKVGEEAGNMEEVLSILARQMEREHELQSKIKGALMYPAVVISAMIGIGILMLVMVVPQLAATFAELDVELPVTTKAVIGLGNFLANYWFLAIILAVAIFLFLFFLSKSKNGKKAIDTIVLKIPIISTLVKKINSASTIRTLSSLIAAGVPIVKSLQIIANTLGNIYYKEAMVESAEKVKKGERLSDIMAPYQELYPIIVIQMIKVGEETGETAKVLSKLAEFFEEEVGNATKNLASIIEPVLMLIIGGAIGLFAISMVQPMYSMLETL